MNEELNNEFPWLVFSIHEEQFAVNSKYVASIVHKSEDIVFVPHEHDYVKGLVTFRGTPIKLIDTRRLLNEVSIESEMKSFNEMIEQRKEDHIRWVDELERCAHCGDHFTLATDPHKCAFGKWYDSFETDLLTIKFHMGKIEEPHRLLHESAAEYNACKKDCEHCNRAECLRTTVEKAKNEYVTEIIEILDEAKEVFKDYFKEMIVAIEAGNTTFGFMVDEVLAVEELEIMGDFSVGATVFRSKFFNGVAKRQKVEKLILLMNIDEMLKLQEDVQITHKQLLSLAGKKEEKASSDEVDTAYVDETTETDGLEAIQIEEIVDAIETENQQENQSINISELNNVIVEDEMCLNIDSSIMGEQNASTTQVDDLIETETESVSELEQDDIEIKE